MYSYKRNFVVYFLMADTVILCLSILSAMYYNGESLSRAVRLSVMLGLPLVWFVIVYWQKLYTSDFYKQDLRRLASFIKSCSILIFLLGLVYLFFTFPPRFSSTLIAFSIGFPLGGILINFIIISVFNRLDYASKRGKNILIIGYAQQGLKMNVYHPAYNLSNGEVQNVSSVGGETDSIEDIQFMKDYLEYNHVDEIVLNLPIETSQEVQDILHLADYHGTRVKIQPNYSSLIQGGVKIEPSSKAVNVHPMPLDNNMSNFLKETFDLVFASIVLVVLLPVFLLIAVLIKLDSPRPVFYCPIRIGKGNIPFKLYKFSTMRVSDPTTGGVNSTQKDDPRITKLGKFLRKYSIDELPQFINVFLGDMSVVGPRPHRTFLNEQFQKSEENYMIRHYYKPGITGWAQVNGWRGPTDTPERKRQRTLHDLWYLENWSFKLDMKIIWMTIFGKKTHDSVF